MTVRVIHATERHELEARSFFRRRMIAFVEADVRELAAVFATLEDEAKEAMAQAVRRLQLEGMPQ